MPYPLMLTLLAALTTWAAVPSLAADGAWPPVEIPGTQSRSLQSAVVGQEYRLSIALPAGYDRSEREYPVVYLLDAQWDFPLVYSIYGEQYYDGFVPGLILVGISWGGVNPDPDRLRRRDFTPTDEAGDGSSGGASAFLSFFEQELFPFIEQEFRATQDRTLVGSSLGGLFCLYALLQRPDLFDRYVATSPATPWDEGVIYNYADGFAARNAEHPARLFLAVGELEDLFTPVQKFVEWLGEQNFKGLGWNHLVVAGAGHSGVKAEGNSRGLQYAFRRPDLKFSAAELKPFVGDFRSVDGDVEVQVRFRAGRLWALLPASGQDLEFKAEDRSHFYRDGEFIKVSFDWDGHNLASGFTVEKYEGTQRFQRVGGESGPGIVD